MTTVALIQARMSSTRFPGKVLEPIAGVPAILFMVRRVRRAATIDIVAVATSNDPSDDPLAEALSDAGIPLFRGDLDDVLRRYADAAAHFGADEIVRLTGDCPLADPTIIDEVVEARRAAGVDYASNIDPPTFPDGLDCECFTRAALDGAAGQATTAADREHVTMWMRSPGSGLRRINSPSSADTSGIRLTVDYPDDLAAVRRLVSLMPNADAFDYADMLRALSANPDILDLNRHERNEGSDARNARQD
ncbi:MAG: cytidylyltransferase domain-containing protein [Gammaproteobacteria bacterium]